MYPIFITAGIRELRDELARIVEDVDELDDAVVSKLKNAQMTIQAMEKGRPNVVILDSSVSVSNEQDQKISGIDLAKEILDKAEEMKIAAPHVVIMTDGPTEYVTDLKYSENLCVVQKSTELNVKIRNLLKEQSLKCAVRTDSAQCSKNLVLNIRPNLHATTWDVGWEIWNNGCKIQESLKEAVPVSKDKTGRLEDLTRNLDRMFNENGSVSQQDWQSEFHNIGIKLSDLLFKDLRLKTRIDDVTRCGQDIRDVAYRFIVDSDAVGVAFEASLDPSEKCYLFVTSPVFRSLSGRDGRREGLWDDSMPKAKDLRVLIIEADAYGQSERLGQRFDKMGNTVVNECTVVQKYFSEEFGVNFSQGGNISIKDCVRLTLNNYGNYNNSKTFKAAVTFLLKSRPWDVVHYAGHSAVAKRSIETQNKYNQAFLIMPLESGRVEELSMAEIAGCAKYVNLLFMSSCQSANDQFSLALTGSAIAKFIGYRWKVDTNETILFCMKFYENYLTNQESAPAAFSHARRTVFHEEEQSAAWASPILCVGNVSESCLN